MLSILDDPNRQEVAEDVNFMNKWISDQTCLLIFVEPVASLGEIEGSAVFPPGSFLPRLPAQTAKISDRRSRHP